MKLKPTYWCDIHEGAYKLRQGGGGRNKYLYVDRIGVRRRGDCDEVKICPMCDVTVKPTPDLPYFVRWGTT